MHFRRSSGGSSGRGGEARRFSSRPRSFGNRGGSSRGGFQGQRIDVNRFINKATITETAEHFVPEHKFSDFAVNQALKKNIESKGYKLPTPIQDRVIPHVLRGSDVVGIANTGTGKTAAFLIPLIEKVLTKRDGNVLIVVPTRELALQIEEEFRGFATGLNLQAVVCVGGAQIGRQMRELRRSPRFVIGTPGRLKDLIKQRYINLASFSTVVLDEADRMLDMGFVADMRYLMAGMPSPRHTLFFSATFSSEIEKLVGEFLTEPVRISVKTQDTSKNVDQDVHRIPRGGKKLDALHDLLANPEFSKVLVFGKTKHGVQRLAKELSLLGYRADAIHGNKTQSKRQKALSAFKDSKIQILVATDVAARGLDITDVSHVINYDLPATYDDYVHRIGRTGRGDKKGKALTFIEG